MSRKTITTNGAQWKAFYSDPSFWPDGVWHEDTVVWVDGEFDEDANLEAVADTAEIKIESGYVLGAKDEDLGELKAYFTKWQKQQTCSRLVIEVPHDQKDLLIAQLPAYNAKVVG